MESYTYSDGDILIIVESTSFKLHKNILRLASVVFRDMLGCGVPSRGDDIPKLEIEQENARDFKNLLSFIYPEKFISINWNNIEGLLRISDKFMVESAIVACGKFLDDNYRRNPMSTFTLADTFNFNRLYKDSSKLILNNYQKFKRQPAFKKISEKSKASLNERYVNFFLGLNSIVKDKVITDFTHVCKNPGHDKILKIEWKKRVKGLTIPLPSPSTVYKKLFVQMMGNHNRKCNDHFTNSYLPRKINDLLGGDFEPLFVGDDRNYIYIEKY